MEPHELALAALSQVARNASDREKTESSSRTNEISDPALNAHARSLEDENAAAQYKSQQVGQQNHGTFLLSSHVKPSSTIDVSTPSALTLDASLSQTPTHNGPSSQQSRILYSSASQELTNYEIASTPSTAGQKRTADGHVKSECPSSPLHSHVRQHSRNISSVSNTSTASSTRIGELTSELRTRLSYAMIKVKKGWQSNSFEEVETLASQKGSPTSSASTMQGRQNLLTSPRAAIATVQAQINNIQRAPGDFDLYCRSEQPSKTYESFWRDHSVIDGPKHRPLTYGTVKSSPPSRVLAPPADIHSNSALSRRLGTPNKYIKSSTKASQNSNVPCSSALPQTPRRTEPHDVTGMKPPPKTTVQEQDAIETLLFMSSPGNVGSPMGPALPPPRSQLSPQGSPLRTEVHLQGRGALGRRVEYGIGLNENENTRREYIMQQQPDSTPQDYERSAAIDRLLDEMGESTSDEDELLLKYATPHRVAAG